MIFVLLKIEIKKFVRYKDYFRPTVVHAELKACHKMNKRFVIITMLSLFLIAMGVISVMVFIEIQQGKSEGLAYAKKTR